MGRRGAGRGGWGGEGQVGAGGEARGEWGEVSKGRESRSRKQWEPTEIGIWSFFGTLRHQGEWVTKCRPPCRSLFPFLQRRLLARDSPLSRVP